MAQRAVITPEFIQDLRLISKSRILELVSRISSAPQYAQARYKQEYGPHIARLEAILSRDGGQAQRAGMDYELEAVTAMVGGLEFSGFGFARWQGRTLLMFDYILKDVWFSIHNTQKGNLDFQRLP